MMTSIVRRFLLCLLTLLLILASCSSGGGNTKEGGSTEEGENESFAGRLLPTSLTFLIDDEQTEVSITWTENGCSFTVFDIDLSFTYHPENRVLDMTATSAGNASQQITDRITFDAKGRITAFNFRDGNALTFSYDGDKVIALSIPYAEDYTPTEIIYNKEEGRIALPTDHYSAPEDHFRFNEQGDIYGQGDSDIDVFWEYTYDENGNLTELVEGDSALTLHYGDAPMVSGWQEIPFRFMLTMISGTTMMFFSMHILSVTLA